MTLLNWVKRNPPLTAAIALPFFLILAFGSVMLFIRLTTPSPAYDFILAEGNYARQWKLRQEGTAILMEGTCEYQSAPLRFYRFRHESQMLEPYDITQPPCDGTPHSIKLILPEGRRFIKGTVAPDGYEYLDRSTTYASDFSPFFIGRHSHRNDIVLRLHKRVTTISTPSDIPSFSAYNTRFIGWLRHDPK